MKSTCNQIFQDVHKSLVSSLQYPYVYISHLKPYYRPTPSHMHVNINLLTIAMQKCNSQKLKSSALVWLSIVIEVC